MHEVERKAAGLQLECKLSETIELPAITSCICRSRFIGGMGRKFGPKFFVES
jgi:hypothetical protein